MRKKTFLPLLIVNTFGLASCATSQYQWGELTDWSGRTNVSLVELIANPGKYDGWKVDVSGILFCQFEGDHLFLTETAYREFQTESAIRIRCQNNQVGFTGSDAALMNGKLVRIGGIFRGTKRERTPDGTMNVVGSWATGVIDPIQFIKVRE
jgi:hypothetical protein